MNRISMITSNAKPIDPPTLAELQLFNVKFAADRIDAALRGDPEVIIADARVMNQLRKQFGSVTGQASDLFKATPIYTYDSEQERILLLIKFDGKRIADLRSDP